MNAVSERQDLAASLADPNAIPPKYKRTEVGVLPEGWDVRRLGDLGDANWGNTNVTKSSYREAGYIAFSATGPDGWVDWYEHDRPAVVLSAIGALCGKSWLATGKWTPIKNTIWIRPGSRLDCSFLYWQTAVPGFWPTRGQAQPFISLGDVRKLLIPVPPLSQQRAIAEALSDVDELLSALDAVIAKKQAIKRAAMQHLLTGKIRLPGFREAWKTKRLGDHAQFLRTGTNSRADLTNDGLVKYLHYGDIHMAAYVKLNPLVHVMPSLSKDRARTLDRLRDGDLVFVDASEDLDGIGKSVEITSVSGAEIVAGLHTIAARFDKSVLADGFKAYLQFCPTFRHHLRRLAAGTKVYATSRSHIMSAEVSLPSQDEQVAIASVLSDMNAGISLLELRRAKTQQIKLGMMQQLLTGRTRIDKPTSMMEATA